MNYGLSCEQVSALINFYVEGSLSETLTKYVKNHLDNCPYCNEKFIKIKTVMNTYNNSDKNETNNQYNTEQYATFKNNLSAYIDNELNDNDNIKIKKLAISNPLARQDLENIFSYKKILQDSYQKTKNEFKNDYSKNIICKIKNDCPSKIDSFYKITALFLAILSIMISSIIIFLYL